MQWEERTFCKKFSPPTAPTPHSKNFKLNNLTRVKIENFTHTKIKGGEGMKKITDRLLIAVFLIFIFGFGISIFAKPKNNFSIEENRALETLEGMSAADTLSGELSRRVSNFFCDQFPCRRRFTALKAKTELSLGRGENNGVIFGESGYLMIKPSYRDLTVYRDNLVAISDFYEEYSADGIDVSVFFAPRGVDVLGAYLPKGYSNSNMGEVWDIARAELRYLIDANADIEAAADAGEYVWYRTDHHWSAEGAYLAYEKISEALGCAALPTEHFEKIMLGEDFYGTVYSKSGVIEAVADEISVYSDGAEHIVVNYDTGEVSDSLYFYEHLDKKDKYSVFLGGNHAHIGVYSEGERETVLVIKDSFANSVIPYLASDYNLEIYDLRYFKGSISEEIERVAPNKILILYGIDTAVTDPSLRYLSR